MTYMECLGSNSVMTSKIDLTRTMLTVPGALTLEVVDNPFLAWGTSATAKFKSTCTTSKIERPHLTIGVNESPGGFPHS